jgi:hypothetical protein
MEFGGRGVTDISLNTPHAVTTRRLDGPAAAKPKRAISPRNIFIYGTLIVVSVYYLLPLYVMIVTSLKGMPEIRLGNIFAPPVEITFEPWVKAWADGLHGSQLRWSVARLLEFGADHGAVCHPVDRHRLGERLRARQLALQGRRCLLHHPDFRCLHPLPGDALSDRDPAARTRHLRHAHRASFSSTPSSACRS